MFSPYTFSYIWSAIYFQTLLWVLYPPIFVILQSLFGGHSKVLLSSENTAALQSIAIMVTPLGYLYWLAAYNKYDSLIQLSIVWRLLLVGPCVVLSYGVLGSMELSAALLIISVDVLTPILAIYFCWDFMIAMPSSIYKHFSQKPIDSSREMLLYVGLSGMALSAFLIYYIFRIPNPLYLQSMPMTLVFIYNIFFVWLSKLQDPKGTDRINIFHGLIIGAILLNCTNFHFRPGWTIAVALFHTCLGALLFNWIRSVNARKINLKCNPSNNLNASRSALTEIRAFANRCGYIFSRLHETRSGDIHDR